MAAYRLQLHVTGGIPGGRTWLDDGAGYDRSLNQFFDLVKAHPDDLKPGVTPDADRIVYKKMMISAALGMTNNTKLWTGGGYDAADVVTRYDIIKTFRANHEKYRFQKDLFDQLSVENMRWVFENRISNEEMPWLANYTLSDALLAKVELHEQKKASKDEWRAFAKTISEKLVEYPYPMQSFLVRIEQQIKNEDITKAEIEAMRIDALRKAQKITEKDSVQWKEINDIANRLLGDKGQEMFLFSFDGVEQLSSTVPWKYSLDGGNKWVEITDHRTEVKLTEQELASITAQNDIKLQIIGINQTHTIDITEGKAPSGYELNHAERRIYTKHDKKPELIEAQVNGTWVKLSENPKLPYSGDFAIRSAATGHALASTGENAPKVHFTDAYDIEGSTVVPATEVTANAASSQHNDEEPERALDGYVGGDSFWHNRWTGDEDAYITVDLGRERTITTIDYWNKGFNHNGMLFEADLSFAGEQAGPADKPIAAGKFSAPKRVKLEWDKQGEPYGARGRAYRITLDEPVTARYVRIRSIQAKTDDGSKPPLFSASELQFYEKAQQVETFVFDGEAAGVLKLGTQFDASDSAWQYSLDGGAHWTDVAASESSKRLSEAELASITAAADIQVRLEGGTKVHTIDIAEGTAPDRCFANNADRKIHVPADGSLSSLEYKQGDTWVDVSEETVFPIDQDIEIRRAAAGTTAASTETSTVRFTDDYDVEGARYVAPGELKVNGASSHNAWQAPELAINGYVGRRGCSNDTEVWHNTWNREQNPWIVIDLGRERTLTHFDYWASPGAGDGQNGTPYKLEVLAAPELGLAADAAVGEDAFKLAQTFEAKQDDYKSTAGEPADMVRVTFDTPVRARYIKLRALSGHGQNDAGQYFSCSELFFYETAAEA